MYYFRVKFENETEETLFETEEQARDYAEKVSKEENLTVGVYEFTRTATGVYWVQLCEVGPLTTRWR